MAKILTPLLLQPLAKRRWLVMSDFHVDTKAAGQITVPAGFDCDLNSVPRFLWWASTPADYPEAGVVHDWAYRGNLERKVADQVYQEVLDALGANGFRAKTRYFALRLFGRFAYDKKDPRVSS